MVILDLLGGAISRVGSRETAYVHRSARWLIEIVTVGPRASDPTARVEAARALSGAIRPVVLGPFVNQLAENDPETIRSAYGRDLERLGALKAAYDPDGVFRLCPNIAQQSIGAAERGREHGA